MEKPKFDPNQPFEVVEAQPQAVAAKPKFDPNKPFEAVDEYVYSEPPGFLEATGRSLEQGLSFGHGDEINAGASALLDTITGRNKELSILDDYYQHLDESRRNFKAAEEEFPITSMVGNIAGGLIPAIVTRGKAAPTLKPTLKQLALTGAGYGAIAGLGNSEAKIGKGEVGQAALDTAIGAGIGSALAPITHVAVEKLTPAAKELASKAKGAAENISQLGPIQTSMESLKQGLGGRNLWGKKANKLLNQELIDETASIADDVERNLNISGKAKTDLLGSPGDDVNVGDWVSQARNFVENLRLKYGQNEAVLKDIEKIQNLINNHVYGVDDAGIPGKGTLFSAEDAENMLRQLGSLGSQGDASLKTSVGKELVNRLISPLKRDANLVDRAMDIPQGYQALGDLVTASRPAIKDEAGNVVQQGLSEINERTSQLLSAKEQLPNINDIANLEKTGLGGINANDRVTKFLETLPEDIRSKYADKMTDLSKAKGVADAIAAPGLNSGFFDKVIHNSMYGGANWTGLTMKAMYDMTPEMLKNLGKSVGSLGSEQAQVLSRIIDQAAGKDRIGRNALFFAIQQNPEYRKLLRQVSGEQEPETDQK